MQVTHLIKLPVYRIGILLSLLFIFSSSSFALTPKETQQIKCRSLILSLINNQWDNDPVKFHAHLKDTEEKLKGLKYIAVVSWEQKEISELNFKLVRYHDVDELAHKLPVYDKTQITGPALVNVNEIRFSQIAAKNESAGGYSVISNARAMKEGKLKPTAFAKLKVWRDVDGNFWTLDHRRLAAMKLSGAFDKIEVEIVSEKVVKADRFKFDTKTNGKSIFVRIEEPGQEPLAIVIGRDDVDTTMMKQGLFDPPPLRGNPDYFQDIVDRYPAVDREKWLKARGIVAMENIRHYSFELSKSLSLLEKKAYTSFQDSYSKFGRVSVRGKSESSILAKLLKKDFAYFSRGEEGITNMKKAVDSLGDGIGARVILTSDETGKLSAANIQKVVDQISDDIRKGMRVSEIKNYRAAGKDGIPYFSDKQIEQIIQADRDLRLDLLKQQKTNPNIKVHDPIIVKSGPDGSKELGYTSFQMNIMHPSKVQYEFQLRGRLVHEVSEIGHFYYDLKAGKPLPDKLKQNAELIMAQKAYNELSPQDVKRVLDYSTQRMIHARRVEAGHKTGPPPSLPADLPSVLSFEKLRPHLLHD